MIGADLIIAAAGAVLAIVAFYMELPVWMVMIVLFIRSIGTAFHTPALSSVTPLLVPEEQLTKCAGYSQSLQSISYIVSPAVAALLYSVWDLNAIIAIDVLGAVIASITVAIVRIPKLGDRVQSLEPNFIREMKEGIVVLRQNKGLFALSVPIRSPNKRMTRRSRHYFHHPTVDDQSNESLKEHRQPLPYE